MLKLAAALSLFFVGCGAESHVTNRFCAIPVVDAPLTPTNPPAAVSVPIATPVATHAHPATDAESSTKKAPKKATRNAVTAQRARSVGAIRDISAFNSVESQTDSTPCIGADETNICTRFRRGEKLCATRAYPLGAKLRIDGLGTCTVIDRTSQEHANRVDWLLGFDVEAAKKFGVKKRLVTPL